MKNIINPFLDRGPVREPALFFGRNDEARKLVQAIGANVPNSVSIIGEKRIGKTSLLNYLAAPNGALKKFASFLARKPEDYIFIHADLSKLKIAGENSALFFFRLLFKQLDKVVQEKTGRNSSIYKTYHNNPNLQDLVEFGFAEYLDEMHRLYPRMVFIFLLDEAEPLIRQGVGAILRSLIEDRPISFILATRLPLVEIDPESEVSPLFNILSDTIQLGLLDQAEARQMIREIAASEGQRFSESELDFIIQISGGHPNFAKVTARRVLEFQIEKKKFDPDLIRIQVYEELESACQSLWKNMEPEEQSLCAWMASGQSPDKTSTSAARSLLQKGILSESEKFFSPLFLEFLANKETQAPFFTPQVRFENKIIRIGEAVMQVSPLELKLFQYLHDRLGQICSREELHLAIWEKKYDPKNQVKMNMTIKRLRDKLQKDVPGVMSLRLERGQGYRLLFDRRR